MMHIGVLFIKFTSELSMVKVTGLDRRYCPLLNDTQSMIYSDKIGVLDFVEFGGRLYTKGKHEVSTKSTLTFVLLDNSSLVGVFVLL
ncbi:hypothetical protein FDB92_11580 [Clostridium butyricum]|nr:hypothetical protein [Clostridium butyricum]NFL31766.1 hypothetical protein [Clostridium butyricum]